MDIAETSRSLKVLIVDDNRDAADSLAVLLECQRRDRPLPTSRFEVRVAYDGREGLQTALAFAPDCVISDIAMPGMDGYALARAVRAEPSLAGVKLIAHSAFADAEHARRAAEAGFDYSLTKAEEAGDLLEVLRMIEEIKELASRTRELAEQNVDLAGQTKDLIQEVKEDVKGLKQDVAELKQEVKELKNDPNDRPAGGSTSPG